MSRPIPHIGRTFRLRTFRCRIARQVGPAVQYLHYVGPLDRIPAGWSIVMRRVLKPVRS